MDERPWEFTTSPTPLQNSSPASKRMATSHVGQVSTDTKSARTSYKDISKPSLGIDLRFEQTYLKSIAPHVRLTTPASDEDEKLGNVVGLQGQRLDIRWGKVIWITTRDQLLAPMFQGIVWGTLSPWIQHLRGPPAQTSTDRPPSGAGAAIVKLKSWLSSIIPQSAPASFRTR